MLEVPGHDLVGGVDDRIAGRVARFADGVAEVEDVVFEQARVCVCLDHHPQPLVLDRPVGPDDRHAVGAVHAHAWEDVDRLRNRRRRPIRQIVAVADQELEVRRRQRVDRQLGDIHDDPVDALVVAGVVGERGRLPGHQRRLVHGDSRRIGRIGQGIIAVEARVVVEDVASEHRVLLRQVFERPDVDACHAVAIAVDDPLEAPLVGRRRMQRSRIARVDRRASGQQGHRPSRPAIVAQRSQTRIERGQRRPAKVVSPGSGPPVQIPIRL